MSPLGRGDETLPREKRLRKRAEYREVQRSRHRVHTRSFLILFSPRSDELTRLGVTVTKKVGNAVRRNRIKRCVREAFRRNPELFLPGVDVVFIAKRGDHVEGTPQIVAELEAAAASLRKKAMEARLGLDAPCPG